MALLYQHLDYIDTGTPEGYIITAPDGTEWWYQWNDRLEQGWLFENGVELGMYEDDIDQMVMRLEEEWLNSPIGEALMLCEDLIREAIHERYRKRYE